MNSSISWNLGKSQRTDLISKWIRRLQQKTGGLFSMNHEHFTEESTGLAENCTKGKEFFNDSLTSDDWLDIFAPIPYDCCDVFPISTDNEENPSSNFGSGITLNFSEIMEDLVNLMSLDKEVFDLQLDVHEPCVGTFLDKNVKSGKRPFDVFDDASTSSLPDHNYYFMQQKKRKVDDVSAHFTIPMKSEQPAQVVKNSKYFERRKKNNIASKRSRETKKHRFLEMEVQADQLEEENEKLKKRIEKLEKLTQQMKEVLVNRLSTSSGR